MQDVVSCIKDVVAEAKLVDEAVKDFVSHDEASIKDGLKKIAEALETLP